MRTLLFVLSLPMMVGAQPALLPTIRGPLQVVGNRLSDESGAMVALRGTSAPADLPPAYAGTMFSTIRQRFNMNVVRLPVAVEGALADPAYLSHLSELVRQANALELVVVLAAVRYHLS